MRARHTVLAAVLAIVAVQWLAPLGVFRFSYAVPLNDEESSGVEYGDETEGFQFSIGQAF